MELFDEGGPLWTHFTIQATCNLCEETIKIQWGVFSVLVTHLKTFHDQLVDADSNDVDNRDSDQAELEPKFDTYDIDKDLKEEAESEREPKPIVIQISKSTDIGDLTTKDSKSSGLIGESSYGNKYSNQINPIEIIKKSNDHFEVDPVNSEMCTCRYCGDIVKNNKNGRLAHMKYWHYGVRERLGYHKTPDPWLRLKKIHFVKKSKGKYKCKYCKEDVVTTAKGNTILKSHI